MSRQAAAGPGPAEARSVRRPSSPTPSRKRPSSSSSSSRNDSSDVLVDEVRLDDPTEERIEAEIVAHLFRGAAPEAYRQAVAQREAVRAKKAALRREVAESRALTWRLRAYTDLLLKTDVSGYSESEQEEYRRELQRRSKECFELPSVEDGQPAETSIEVVSKVLPKLNTFLRNAGIQQAAPKQPNVMRELQAKLNAKKIESAGLQKEIERLKAQAHESDAKVDKQAEEIASLKKMATETQSPSTNVCIWTGSGQSSLS